MRLNACVIRIMILPSSFILTKLNPIMNAVIMMGMVRFPMKVKNMFFGKKLRTILEMV